MSRLLCLSTLAAAAAVAGAQTVSEQYLLAAANQDRALHGLGPVRWDARLTQAAVVHAREMARRGGISHQFSGEPDLADRASTAGARFSLVTENVAEAPNSAQIHDMWMHSAGHRANLLDPKVDSVGISVIQRDGQLYAVEDFARSVSEMSFAAQEAVVSRLVAKSGLSVSEEAEDARRTCALPTGFAGARKPWFVMRYSSADLTQLPAELTSRLGSGKYHAAAVGACSAEKPGTFAGYNIAVLLYP
ncbi:CAP domain-containing protein [Granulicella rosea]|uniref:CAP domain-containing protein n=1 Tax=Granulicella rosea TaxID=474952 RepID=UPI001594FA47|nr:CAP domain-containing protein [Granulicella rosea]